MCRHYDAHRAGQCRELAAERVADKTHANDCGWFLPRPEAYKGGGAAMAQASRSALDALIGEKSCGKQPDGEESAKPAKRNLLDDLFKK